MAGKGRGHFTASELRCKDGCGWQTVDPLLLVRLERLRKALGKPVPIVSGRRCPVHNQAVGGADRSRHVYGDAVDIPEGLGVTRRLAVEIGFTGIGLGSTGKVRHLDVRPSRSPVVWTY